MSERLRLRLAPYRCISRFFFLDPLVLLISALSAHIIGYTFTQRDMLATIHTNSCGSFGKRNITRVKGENSFLLKGIGST